MNTSFPRFIFPKTYFFRINGQDFYKVKWSGWPEIAWSWVHIGDMEALEKINDFRSALISNLPINQLPKQIPKQKRYTIPTQYKLTIKTNYKKQKDELKLQLVKHQNRVRKIDPTVLVENEEDLIDFPPEKVYKFIKSTAYKLPPEDMEQVKGKRLKTRNYNDVLLRGLGPLYKIWLPKLFM